MYICVTKKVFQEENKKKLLWIDLARKQNSDFYKFAQLLLLLTFTFPRENSE